MNGILTSIVAGALALTMSVGLGAAHHRENRPENCPENRDCQSQCRFVDVNQDGICDNHGAGCRHTDADHDGICDTHGESCGYADGNGACGSRESAGHHGGSGHHGGGHHSR